MKRKIGRKKKVWAVFHTTEEGADYLVKSRCKTYEDAVEWEHNSRDLYPRPLIIREIRYD